MTVTRTNHGRGAGRGALIGSGSSFLFFTILAAVNAEKDRYNPEPASNAGAMRGMVVMSGTLLGTMLGTLGGAAVGVKETYECSTGLKPNPSSLTVESLHTAAAVPAMANIMEPSTVRHVLRGGIDIQGTFSSHPAAFNEGSGYTFGAATGFNLSRKEPGRYILGIELQYTKIASYAPGVTIGIPFITSVGQGPSITLVTQYPLERMHRASFLDIGICPAEVWPLGGGVDAAFYAGAAFGLGSEEYVVLQQNSTTVPVAQFRGVYGSYEDLYGDRGAYGRTTAAGIIGISLYHRWATIDVRFKSTKMTGGQSYQNMYFQAGIIL
ncbi:MAG TPA: hypothetical protein VK470_09360 [Bacteroidota bacterium]|nr:hypothetical protein [Bacteroidota bacterium]